MLSICKSCKVQNQAIKKDCTLHYIYLSLGHSENIRHIIFRITDIMPFCKSTNSMHILLSPGNCPTSQLFLPLLLVWQPAQLAGILCRWYSGSHPSCVSAAKTIQHSHAMPASYAGYTTGLASPLVF